MCVNFIQAFRRLFTTEARGKENPPEKGGNDGQRMQNQARRTFARFLRLLLRMIFR